MRVSLNTTLPGRIVFEPIRGVRRETLWVFLVAHFTLTAIVNLVFFAGNTFRPLASATGGLFTGSLVVNLLFLAVLGGGVILYHGRLRPYDVGLIAPRLVPALLFTLALWCAAQGVHLLAGIFSGAGIALHPMWTQGGAVVGLLLSQIFGNALFEEIAYRGFLFPQIYLHLERDIPNPLRRITAAVLLSQAIFALVHIPNRIYLGMGAGEIAVDLLMLVGWGVLYTLIYLRTDNLFLVVGVHALGNAPTTLFATATLLDGAGASLLLYALAAFALFGWPMLRAYRERARLAYNVAGEGI